MSVKLLFNLILKIIGILFVKDLVVSFPNLFAVVFDLGRGDVSGAFVTLAMTALTFGIYGAMIYYFLFKADYLIAKFKLTDSTTPEEIPLNVHRSTVISIALMIVALLLITQAIPLVVRGLFNWYMYRQQTKGFMNVREPFDYSMLVVYASEIVIGLLIIGQLRSIVSFIELKQRKAGG